MKHILLTLTMFACTLSAQAKTNQEIISGLTLMDRMVACSMAHESWQYNAPDEEQAAEHRTLSSQVMDAAAKEFGAKAYLRMASPEVMAFKMVALNRASISLEPALCKGFTNGKKFSVSGPEEKPRLVNLTQQQEHLLAAIESQETIDDFYQLMSRKDFPGQSLRVYMCWNAFATDPEGERYETLLSATFGPTEKLEEVVEGNRQFKKFYEHAIGQYQGQFVENFCQDSKGSPERVRQIADAHSGYGYVELLDRSEMPVTRDLLCALLLNDDRFLERAERGVMGVMTEDDISYFFNSHGVQKLMQTLKAQRKEKSFQNLYCHAN